MGRIATSAVLSLLLVAFAVSATVKAEEPSIRWHRDLAIARKIATAMKRPLLVLVTTEACMPCLQLKSTTLKDERVALEIRRSFVAVSLDAGSHPEVKRLRIPVYPTTLIVTPDFRVMDAIIGYVPPEQMQQRLRRASQVRVAQKGTVSVQ